MEFFNIVLIQPTLNFLLVLTNVMFSNFGLGIIALTIIVRLVMLPLTLKQFQASKKMQESTRAIQPKLQALKKKYAKDPRKLQQETMSLYKEAGISPMGCLASPMFLTMLIQLPIFVALYRAIIQALATTPQDFLSLSENLYSWSIVRDALPVSGSFLWLNLSAPDQFLIIPILVMATMWLTQKMMAQPALDPQQASMQNMMQIMMPLMFGFITFTLPSGLGLYFLFSAVVSIVIQGFVYGWKNPFAKAENSVAPAAKAPSQPGPTIKVGKSDSQAKEAGIQGPVIPSRKKGFKDVAKSLSPFEDVSNPEEGVNNAGKPRSKRKDG